MHVKVACPLLLDNVKRTLHPSDLNSRTDDVMIMPYAESHYYAIFQSILLVCKTSQLILFFTSVLLSNYEQQIKLAHCQDLRQSITQLQ